SLIAVVAPLDEKTGDVNIVVSNENGASDAVKVRKAPAAPAIKSAVGSDGRRYALAAASDGTVLGKPGTDPDVQRAAQPGERISLLISGCGPTDPLSAADRFVTAEPVLLATPIITINGQPMDVRSGKLIFPGFYQIDVTVPDGLQNGDYPIVAGVEGGATSSPTYFTVAR